MQEEDEELLALVSRANRARRLGAPDEDAEGELQARQRPATRLAVYGTLAPGESNHHVIADLRGTWSEGTVCGSLHPRGWGMTSGYPGFRMEGTERVPVLVLESADLTREVWQRIDAFEGRDYCRILVSVSRRPDGEPVLANLYALRVERGAAFPRLDHDPPTL